MGTPDFAVPALKMLVGAGHHIAMAVTQPDRQAGRGQRLIFPPLKKVAAKLGIQVTQPESVRTDAFQKLVTGHHPDLLVVVAFGQILPQNLLQVPSMGAMNVHASLLPKYRGSAPIQWAIIKGEKETGVTTMLMDKGMDTGDILLTKKVPIGIHDSAQILHDHLSEIGAKLLIETIEKLSLGKLTPRPQNHDAATYAPLLKKSDGRIDWNQPAARIEAFIRGMTPWPGAFTFFQQKRLKIFKAIPIAMETQAGAGTVVHSFPDELRVAAGRQILSIVEIQSAAGKRLPIKNFLHGNPIPPGSLFN